MGVRFLIAADVGAIPHVGEEAMLAANLAGLRRLFPGASFMVISADSSWKSRIHGVDVVGPIGFSTRAERPTNNGEYAPLLASWLRAVQRGHGERHPAGDDDGGPTVLPVRKALLEADALIVSGGGNLCSTWPHHLYERAALLRAAVLLGKPAIVLGQTLGPDLSERERELLATSLPLAQLVGARERPSVAVALSLGVPPNRLIYQLDDAFFLAPSAPREKQEKQARIEALCNGAWIAVTVHPFASSPLGGDEAPWRALAAELSRVAESTGARLVFIPHAAGEEGNATASDVEAARWMASFIPADVAVDVLDEVWSAPEVRWLTGRASLVISTRYHPLVFALSAGVPALGLWVDSYTRVKIEGALAHGGLDGWSLPLEAGLRGDLSKSAVALWADRMEIQGRIEARLEGWRRLDHERWYRIARALGFPGTSSGCGVELDASLVSADFCASPSTIVLRSHEEMTGPTSVLRALFDLNVRLQDLAKRTEGLTMEWAHRLEEFDAARRHDLEAVWQKLEELRTAALEQLPQLERMTDVALRDLAANVHRIDARLAQWAVDLTTVAERLTCLENASEELDRTAREARREFQARARGLVEERGVLAARLSKLERVAPEWWVRLADLSEVVARLREELRCETEEARIFVGRVRRMWPLRARRFMVRLFRRDGA